MDILEDKYIELLLKRCLNFDKSKSLFINYDVVNTSFVEKVVIQAKNMGITDIYLDEEDINKEHSILSKITLDEIETHEYFDKHIWDEYASKDASFLLLETEFPKILDDIDSSKIARANYIKRKTKPIYKEKQAKEIIPWCIAALPNKVWADSIFKNDPNSYNKLFYTICKMCMLDEENPIESWNNYLKKSKKLADKLNSLEIKSLHYINNLGTDLKVEYPKNSIWCSAATENSKVICNMPSYEIFSSPDYTKTNGIVYSSKPLVHNGALIDEFYIKFENGKVVEYDAKTGKDVLKGIIESDSNACFLGETALVEYNSPISNTGLIFGTTLFDENASCHLALGDGFPECIKDGLNKTRDELNTLGINHSNTHVDFMIGTSDLNIEADTNKGKIQIFKDGNFTLVFDKEK